MSKYQQHMWSTNPILLGKSADDLSMYCMSCGNRELLDNMTRNTGAEYDCVQGSTATKEYVPQQVYSTAGFGGY